MGKEKVNHPSHYNREDAMECIDEMIMVFGKEAVRNFCLCNVWKYRYRATDKNGEEDLKKSDWYLNKYKELCEEDTIREEIPSTTTVTYPALDSHDKWWHQHYIPPTQITCTDKIN